MTERYKKFYGKERKARAREIVSYKPWRVITKLLFLSSEFRIIEISLQKKEKMPVACNNVGKAMNYNKMLSKSKLT